MFQRSSGLLMLVLLYACTPAHGEAAPDTSGVDVLLKQYEAAWNARDAKAYSKLLTDDATWVNVNGSYFKGRQKLEEARTAAQEQFKGRVWKPEHVEIAFLKPDIALVHVDWTIRGAGAASGVLSLVVVKQTDGWRIRAADNTKRN